MYVGYKKILNVSEPEEDVNAIMNNVDKNNSGYIDYTGFIYIIYENLYEFL